MTSRSPIAPLSLEGFRFPGAAGVLQQRGPVEALVAELGRNYDAYHAVVAERYAVTQGKLVALRGSPASAGEALQAGLLRNMAPNSRDFGARHADWLATSQARMSILHAEILLRVARVAMQTGKPASLELFDPTKPLLADDESALQALS